MPVLQMQGESAKRTAWKATANAIALDRLDPGAVAVAGV
jgi:hypothetical protein